MSAKNNQSSEVLEEADRLNVIFQKRALEFGFTQTAFAQEHGFGEKGNQVVWQYLNGYMALNLSAAAKFAQGLLCAVGDFSPRLAKEIESLGLVQRHTPVRFEEQLLPNERRLVQLYRAVGKEGKALLAFWAESYLSKEPKPQPFFDDALAPVSTPEGPPKSVFASLLDNPIITSESPKTPKSAKSRVAVGEEKADKPKSGAHQNVEGGRRKQKRVG